MKKLLLLASLAMFPGVPGAQEVNCDLTPYYGVCPVCEAHHEANPERLAALRPETLTQRAPGPARDDCDLMPYRNGICQVE